MNSEFCDMICKHRKIYILKFSQDLRYQKLILIYDQICSLWWIWAYIPRKFSFSCELEGYIFKDFKPRIFAFDGSNFSEILLVPKSKNLKIKFPRVLSLSNFVICFCFLTVAKIINKNNLEQKQFGNLSSFFILIKTKYYLKN